MKLIPLNGQPPVLVDSLCEALERVHEDYPDAIAYQFGWIVTDDSDLRKDGEVHIWENEEESRQGSQAIAEFKL